MNNIDKPIYSKLELRKPHIAIPHNFIYEGCS